MVYTGMTDLAGHPIHEGSLAPSVIEVIVYSGEQDDPDGGRSVVCSGRRLWSTWETATTHGLEDAIAWLKDEGIMVDLVERHGDKIENRRYWSAEEGSDTCPAVEMLEWHVHDGTETDDDDE